MKPLLLKLLAHTAAPWLRLMHRNKPLILMFHGFTDREHKGCENSQHKHLHIQKFETFLQHLQKHYQIVSLNDVVYRLSHGTSLPKRAVVLTFDDGFRSNYALAYPLLKRFKAPATIYLATEFIDVNKPIWTDRIDYIFSSAGKPNSELKAVKKQLKQLPQEQIESAVLRWEDQLHSGTLTGSILESAAIYHPLEWDHVREMQASGLVTFGAHTHTHKILGRCEPETVRRELQTSKAIIERELATPCLHFCYPNGSQGDFSALTEQCVQEAGFQSSVTTLNGRVRSQPNAFLLPRLGITNDLDLARFDLLSAGYATVADQLRTWRSSLCGDTDQSAPTMAER